MERHFCKNDKSSDPNFTIKITQCAEDDDLTLWLENELDENNLEGVQVNYCPFCGYEAKVKIGEEVL
jgi:Zn ribbon nucleic-acid-binding protein